MKKLWGDAEIATLHQHYARLGAAGMRRAGYLADRPVGSISKQANLRGLAYELRPQANKVDPNTPWPMPRMDLLESLDCVRLRNWSRYEGAPPMQLTGMVA